VVDELVRRHGPGARHGRLRAASEVSGEVTGDLADCRPLPSCCWWPWLPQWRPGLECLLTSPAHPMSIAGHRCSVRATVTTCWPSGAP